MSFSGTLVNYGWCEVDYPCLFSDVLFFSDPKCSSIHPSIVYTHLVLPRVIEICWSLSHLSLGERQEYTLDRSPVHRGAQSLQILTNLDFNFLNEAA